MSEYTPVDTSEVKLSKIKVAKDLEQEIKDICAVLDDTTTHQWADRVKAMQSIQSIVCTESCREISNFFKVLPNLVKPLTVQLLDLRSAISKEASATVRIMVQTLGDDFSFLSTKFMHESSLFKLVSCATKILNEQGHLC